MAIDQTEKAKNLAIATVEATDQFMSAFEKLIALEEQRVSSGLDLTAFDDTYASVAGLAHVDGAALNAVLNNSIPTIWSYMLQFFHDDNLQKVRP